VRFLLGSPLTVSPFRQTPAHFLPQGIDNLRSVVSRGIIREGFAATRNLDRQIPTRRPGRMAGRRSRDLQHPMFGR